jgi:COPI associated protein/EF-hand domain pair
MASFVSEATPLQGVSQVASSLLSKENLDAASTAVQAKWNQVKNAAQEGNISLRVLALVAGVVLTVTAAFGLLGKLLTLHIFQSFLEMYTLLLGIIMLLLESPKQLQLPESWQQSLYHYALFLKFVWGRGILYFVAGTLHLSQSSGLFDLITIAVGGYVTLVGVIFIVTGYSTSGKFSEIRSKLYNEDTLRQKFNEADTGGKKALTLEQFQDLITKGLDIPMSKAETQIAFQHLDKDNNGVVAYDEVKLWWSGWAAPAPGQGEGRLGSLLQATAV